MVYFVQSASCLSSLSLEKPFLIFNMPVLNGDAMTNNAANTLDCTKALEVLKNEYPERDGIDVQTLIDSKANGGLTYNDFLMLPGYIGMCAPCSNLRQNSP